MGLLSAGTEWRAVLKRYLSPDALRMLALGFAAGLPLLLVLGTLSFRLREAGIDRSTISELSWVGLAYGFKWCWSPLVDRVPLPLLTAWLGRRRSWLLVAQLCIVLGLLGMAQANPTQGLGLITACALAVAFASATQDIALDAFRIESAPLQEQGVLVANYQAGYRLGMIWAGAGVLWLAAGAEVNQSLHPLYQQAAWQWAYGIMAASMLLGMVAVLSAPEPVTPPMPAAKDPAQWLQTVVFDPFQDMVARYGWHLLAMLLLVGTYRISDIVMGIMANPFYVDMGYTKQEVATVTKVYGVVMTLVGSYIGGMLALRWSIGKLLMVGATASAATNLLFMWLAGHGHDVKALIGVVSLDNLSGGIASAGFVVYLSSLINVRFSATQYALLSSMAVLAPKWLAGFSGHMVDAWGYPAFFAGTAMLGVPVLGLVWWVMRLQGAEAESQNPVP